MDRLKNSFIIASYVLLVTMFFFGGYAFGNYTNTRKVSEAMSVTPAPPAVIPAAAVKETEDEKNIVYTVIIENGRLCLFKEENNIRTLISGEEISENIYPADDIAALKRGIELETMEKAQELFENFVS